MQTVTVEEAQAQLSRLISQIGSGEDVVITQDDKPIAKLVSVNGSEAKKDKPRPRRQAGTAKGMVWISPDFDEPLEDFKEYVPAR